MPRLTDSKVPAYRHYKARNLACCDIGGKRYYLGPWKSKASYEEYDRLVAEWLANGRRLSSQDSDEPNAISVAELILAYVRHAKAYYRKHGRPTAEARLIADALRIVKRLYGGTTAADFGPIAYKAVRHEMIKLGWGRKHINKQCDRVKRMFRWSASEELVPGSVYETLRCVPGLKAGRCKAKESRPVLPVPEDAFQATLSCLPEIVADMVRFQRLTGARPSEVCDLRPGDVDRSGDIWLFRPGSHKTERYCRERVVFIGPKAQALLAPYLLRAADAFCFSPAESEQKRRAEQHAKRKTPLSCGNRPGTNQSRRPKRPAGERYTTESYRRAVHRACDRAFPPPSELQREDHKRWQAEHRWSPNRLRHSAATEIRAKYGLEAAQVILGHSKADVTQVYAERDASLARRVMAEVG